MTLAAPRRQALRTLMAGIPALLLWSPFANAQPAPDAALLKALGDQTGLDPASIRQVLRQARFLPDIIRQIRTPYEARPYAEYRSLFVTDAMRRGGLAYLKRHRPILQRQWQRYRVEPEIIAAILGMESRFGQRTGKHRVLDALYTLATGYERRADFFRRQLGEFLTLCREESLDPLQVRGSYAGAFGATQFIPSSYRAYAVDADGDGKRDVWNSVPDITASVANYFHSHGWMPGKPIAHWLPVIPELRSRAREGIRHFTPLATLRRQLPPLPSCWSDRDEVALVQLQRRQGPAMLLVHRNFYVITRWNRSYNYAMATAEIAAMLGCTSCLGC